MIPKIIHYCWFGDNEKKERIKKCIASWSRVNPDYEILEWNETNCKIDENLYVAKAYEKKNYAFVSDYFRLRALKEYGGFYLDTDVICYKKFDSLLSNKLVVGYMYCSLLGTAVIGAEKGNVHISNILEYYHKSNMDGYDCFTINDEEHNIVFKCNNNNDLFTWYFLKNIEEFRLNGKKYMREGICVLPKEELEVGYVLGTPYTVHYCDASWKERSTLRELLKHVKGILKFIPIVHFDILLKKITIRRHERKSRFYSEYIRNVERET